MATQLQLPKNLEIDTLLEGSSDLPEAGSLDDEVLRTVLEGAIADLSKQTRAVLDIVYDKLSLSNLKEGEIIRPIVDKLREEAGAVSHRVTLEERAACVVQSDRPVVFEAGQGPAFNLQRSHDAIVHALRKARMPLVLNNTKLEPSSFWLDDAEKSQEAS